MDQTEELREYHQLQARGRGRQGTAQGRRWQRGQPRRPTFQGLEPLTLVDQDGHVRLPDGTTLACTIKQLFPATDWQARYADEEGGTYLQPVAFLAFCELTAGEHTRPSMLGVDYTEDGGWCFVTDYDNFLSLLPPWEA